MSVRYAPLYGLAFGVVLAACSLVSAGVGHGNYLPFLTFGAPFSIIPTIGLFTTPVMWTLFGWLLRGDRPSRAAILLTIHTLTAGAILLMGSGKLQRDIFGEMASLVGFVIYGIGLLVAWTGVVERLGAAS